MTVINNLCTMLLRKEDVYVPKEGVS